MLAVEELYTDSSINFQREWDFKHVRERTIAMIEKAESVDELAQQLLKLDQGFSHPHSLKYKNAGNDGREDLNEEE